MNQKSYKDMLIGGLLDVAGSSKEFKTGDWRSLRPIWDKNKCTHCMICQPMCPEGAILICNQDAAIKRKETDLDYCKGCGICANVCILKCITMKKEEALK